MDKILTLFFIFFLLVLFPLGEVLRIDLQNNIAITGIDIGVVLLVIIGLIQVLYKRESISFHLLKPLVIFILVCVLSLIINSFQLKQTDLFVAALYLLRWIMYAGIYFVVKSISHQNKEKISMFMVISGGITLLIGYVQYFLYPNLRNLEYLGWDVHLYRMFGSFLDPNFFGAYLVLFFLFLVGCYKTFQRVKPLRLKNAILLFLSLLTLVGIILTYSRSAYLMLVVGLLTLFFIQKLKVTKKMLGIFAVVACISIISYLVFTRYSEGTNLLRITSTKARIGSSENALLIFEKNPLFGVGFDAYRYAQKRYGMIKTLPLVPSEQGMVPVDHGAAGTDNSWLFVLATTGVLGFAAYVYVWWRILKLAKRQIVISTNVERSHATKCKDKTKPELKALWCEIPRLPL